MRIDFAIKEARDLDREKNFPTSPSMRSPALRSPRVSAPVSPNHKVKFTGKLEEVNSDGEGENKVDEHEFDIDAPLDDEEE